MKIYTRKAPHNKFWPRTEDQTISFFEEIGLILSPNSIPPLCCGLPMSVENLATTKLKLVWKCTTKGSKKKRSKSCRKTINPTLRHHNGDSELSTHTVCDYFSYCRNIAEVITSHTEIVFGGDSKTVQIDETFLTKRKYNRGRITEQMTTTVLGLYCKEDKAEHQSFFTNTWLCFGTDEMYWRSLTTMEGLTLKEIDSPSLSAEDALSLPPAKRPRLDDNVDEVIDDFDIETAIRNDVSSSESNSDDLC
ncbi:hypothetical protein PV326_006695 [Microctonus aethiopoides]|nr:hypothetical protein PV326_006695 [Microctonus aethiopoides]